MSDGEVWSAGGVFTLFAVLFFFTGVQMIGIGMIGSISGGSTPTSGAAPLFSKRSVGRREQ